jgi:putative transposase
LAESFVDLFKTELIADRVWRTNAQLELAVVACVGWFNPRRLRSSIGNRPPIEHDASTGRGSRSGSNRSGSGRPTSD